MNKKNCEQFQGGRKEHNKMKDAIQQKTWERGKKKKNTRKCTSNKNIHHMLKTTH